VQKVYRDLATLLIGVIGRRAIAASTNKQTDAQYNTIQYNTKFVKCHVAVASDALANRTVKKHRRKRANVL